MALYKSVQDTERHGCKPYYEGSTSIVLTWDMLVFFLVVWSRHPCCPSISTACMLHEVHLSTGQLAWEEHGRTLQVFLLLHCRRYLAPRPYDTSWGYVMR